MELYHLRLGYYLVSVSLLLSDERMTLYSAHAPNCVATFHLMIDLMLSHCFVNKSTESLWLSYNALVSQIPTEIGLLTQLSEYTCDCCHDVLAQSLWVSIHIHLTILMVCSDSLCSFS
jgi:hypothetical protein